MRTVSQKYLLRFLKKWWLFGGYLAGLPLIFGTWYIAEHQVLRQCIACFASYVSYVAPEVCCDTEEALLPYTWLMMIANVIYASVIGGIILKAQKNYAILSFEGGNKAEAISLQGFRPIIYLLFLHIFITASAVWTALSLQVYITHYPFREWRQAEGAFYVGIIPTALAFFILRIFLKPVLDNIARWHKGGE